MSNWRNDRNLGPWEFKNQHNKFGFVNNPRWTEYPASETEHKPDGYWYRFKVNQYVHNLIEKISLPAGAQLIDVNASKSCEILYVLYTIAPYSTIWMKYSATYGVSFRTKKLLDNVRALYSFLGSRISDDGQYMFLTAWEKVTNRSILLKSSDGLGTFAEVMFNPWYGINPSNGIAVLTYSGNGKVLTLDFYDYNILYQSLDYGVSWSFRTFADYHHIPFYFTQADKTGQHVLGIAEDPLVDFKVYYSHNYGISWVYSGLDIADVGISPVLAVSGNGQVMMIGRHVYTVVPDMFVYYRFELHISSNYGVSFTLLDVLPYMSSIYMDLPNVRIGMSDNGRVIAVISQGYRFLVWPPTEMAHIKLSQGIYVSRDYGATWEWSDFFDMFDLGPFETPDTYLLALKVSNDGKTMFCSDYPGQRLFYSFDSGKSWAGYGTSVMTEVNTGESFIKPVWNNP